MSDEELAGVAGGAGVTAPWKQAVLAVHNSFRAPFYWNPAATP